MAKRSMTSRIGMLALSFALVFSMMSPMWLFAAELVMPESETETPAVDEDQAPIVVQDPLEEAPAPNGEKQALETGKPTELQVTAYDVPDVTGDVATWAFSDMAGSIACPGDEVWVEMEGYYDGMLDRRRGLRISLPNSVTDVTVWSSEAWETTPVPQWYSVASSITSTPDGSDRTWWEIRSDAAVDANDQEFRVVVSFAMPDTDVMDTTVESGSRDEAEPFLWFWGNEVSIDTIYAAVAGLTVGKSVVNGDDPMREIQNGTTVEVTVEIENTGNLPLSAIDIYDALPPGFYYVAGSAELDGSPFMLDAMTNPGSVQGELVSLAVGETVFLAYSMIAMGVEIGHYDPIVSLSAAGPCGGALGPSDSACVHVVEPNLMVEKTVDPNTGIEPGDVLGVTITLENMCEDAEGLPLHYAGTAYNVVINDTIPAGFTYVAGSAMISINGADPVPAIAPTMWELGDLEPCDVIVITYDVLAGANITPDFVYGAAVSVAADGQAAIEAEADITTAEEEDEVGQMGYNDWLWIAMVLLLAGGAVVAGRLSLRKER